MYLISVYQISSFLCIYFLNSSPFYTFEKNETATETATADDV